MQTIHSTNNRFTLIELLVVIVIILILAGMLLPVLGQARARAKMASCTNQLTQFGLALVQYRDDHDNTMVPWMSNLMPDYGTTQKLYICPQDPSGGFDGSRHGAGLPENKISSGPISIDGSESPDGQPDMYPIVDQALKDEFFNTDDTSRNPWRLSGNPDVERSSYLYEFPDVECTWASTPPFVDSNNDGVLKWSEVKPQQLSEGWEYTTGWVQRGKPWDSHLFPAVRCFHHWKTVWGNSELVLNTSYDGGFFKSKLTWEEGIWQ